MVLCCINNKTVFHFQTEPDGCATFGDYVTGKLKDAFESHFGPAPKPFVDGETAESSPAQTDSTFDKLKSKIYTVHNSNINGYDAPDTENDEHKIKATVTKTYIEYCQPPNPDTIASKLIENGMTVGTQVSKIEKEMNSNESSSNESDDSDDDDDEFENIIELYDVEINEEDFNKVKQESMELQVSSIMFTNIINLTQNTKTSWESDLEFKDLKG